MFTSILVPLDGTVFAEAALPYAMAAARRTGGVLHPVMVHLTDQLHDTGLRVAAGDAEDDSPLRASERDYLDRIVDGLRDAGARVDPPELLRGQVDRALAEHVERRGVDGVVLASHGRSDLERLIMPGVADGLVRRVAVPVLRVRGPEERPAPAAGRRPAPAPGFRRVVVAVDGGPDAEAALEAARVLAEPGAALTLVRVVAPPPLLSSSYIPHAVVLQREERTRRGEEAKAYLARLAEDVASGWGRIETRQPVHRRTADAILDVAQEAEAELVVTGSGGHRPVVEMILGSVSHDVVRGARAPVLVLHPRGRA